MPLALVAYALCFGSAAVLGLASFSKVLKSVQSYIKLRVQEASHQLGDVFVQMPAERLRMLHLVAPPAAGALLWLASGQWMAGLAGVCLGLFIPKLAVGHLTRVRVKTFHAQLVDGLLLLSSCLRAGLSLVQSFTVLVEEMPPPISQEFSLVLKETRMGVSLDETLVHLKQRMPSDDLHLFVTAVLVARETGGDITAIFTQLVETLRERKKVRERIKTLTFMARMQGIVMGLLPIAFAYTAYTTNPQHFKYFTEVANGRVLLMLVVGLELMAAVMFVRFSRAPM